MEPATQNPASQSDQDPSPMQIPLKFLAWQPLYETEKPFQIFINIPPSAKDKRTTNLVHESISIPITDVCTLQSKPTLDGNGFKYCRHRTEVNDFTVRENVENVYMKEVEALLRREVDGVGRVFFFDWRLRKNALEVEGEVIDLNSLTAWLRPAMHVHIDQSPAAALNRIKLQLKEEADSLLKGRVRIINVWRPIISTPVEDWPLAVGDGSTISPNDLVEADHIRRHYMGSTMYLQHNPKQKFYYMSKQTKEDVLIFKNFDSRRDVKARYAPHASFRHPGCPSEFQPRESIEVRALVFTHPEKDS